jgi:hypothetical protein
MTEHAWLPRIDALDVHAAADGSFALDACFDSVQLAFTAPGLATVRRWTSPAATAIDVEMVREARIAVNVRDPAGEPAGGALVQLTTFAAAAAGAAPAELLAWERRTAADGNALFDGLPAGVYVAAVTAPEVAPHVSHVRVTAGDSVHVAARLERGVLLRGSVRDGSGQPLAAVRVVAMAGVDPPFAAGTAHTDERGTYRLRLPRQRLTLRLADVPAGWRDPLDVHPLDLTLAGRWAERDFGLEPVLTARH